MSRRLVPVNGGLPECDSPWHEGTLLYDARLNVRLYEDPNPFQGTNEIQ